MRKFGTILLMGLVSLTMNASTSFKAEKEKVVAYCDKLVANSSTKGKFNPELIKLSPAKAKKYTLPHYTLACLMVGQFHTEFVSRHEEKLVALTQKNYNEKEMSILMDELSELIFKDTKERHVKALSGGKEFNQYYEEKVEELLDSYKKAKSKK